MIVYAFGSLTGEALELKTCRSGTSTMWLKSSPKLVDLPRKNVLDEYTVAEQRKSRRFELKLPVQLVRSGSRQMSHTGETLNVSSAGVLLSDPSEPMEIGQPIEYLISLPTGKDIGEVRLRCMGKVIRHDVDSNAVAVTLERYEFVRAHAARF